MVFAQLTKEQAKEEVKHLVEKYVRIAESGRLKSYNEEMTKKELIEPLFEALGWDVRNTINDEEVLVEEKISKGRVDYSFRIGGIPKFFLEAKSLKEDLDNPKFIEQAINYAWHKGCTWAVLTDFEAIKIFNAEWKSINPLQAQFGQTLPCQLFLEKFDQLWLLSKESFEKKALDAEAEKWGKKVKKIPVDKQLLSDLTNFRDMLNKNILKNNSSKNVSGDELDEAVQRIIDRLIFIRTLEDKELEAPALNSLVREDRNKRIYKKLNLLFRKIDDIYNSKLFTPHLCEELEIDDEVLEKIIDGLFKTSDNTVLYDFSAIDADVLGNIYEQYLGYILKKTDKRAKLAEGKAHRKEQGIYYTPTYVVDYIVKNTVGELAKDKKFDLTKIKVLDPACGSGSFLIKAFDYLVTLDKKKNRETEQTKLDLTGTTASYGRKVEILKNNIFGVDLDPKAVEIAQLNLLLKAAEKKHRLPTLQENIRVGNSLIDDTAIAGNRAFKWEEQFKEIIDEGGFDVVIGNPPYVKLQTLNKNQIDFFYSKYESAIKHYDIYILFVEKALSLLKENGVLGFILPSKFLTAEYGQGLRKLIRTNHLLLALINFKDFQVFEGASTYTCLLFLKKSHNKTFDYYEIERLANQKNIMPSLKRIKHDMPDSDNAWNFSSKDMGNLINKLNQIKTKLSDFTKDIFQGFLTGRDKLFFVSVLETKGNLVKIRNNYDSQTHMIEISVLRKLLKGKEIRRNIINWNNSFVIYPYEEVNGITTLIPLKRLEKEFPNLFAYLIKYKKQFMSSTTQEKVDESNWYRFRRARSINQFTSKKIITQVLANRNSFSLDNRGEYFFVGGGNAGGFGILLKEEYSDDYCYFISILNSKLLEVYLKNISTPFRGGYYSYGKRFIERFPIIIPSKKQKEYLSELAKKQIDNLARVNELKNKQTDEKVRLEKEIQKLDNEIDEEVFRLYGITAEEKRIIEDSLKQD